MDRKLEVVATKALTGIGESRVLSRIVTVGLIAAAAFGAGALLGRTRQERPTVPGLAPADEANTAPISLDALRNAGL